MDWTKKVERKQGWTKTGRTGSDMMSELLASQVVIFVFENPLNIRAKVANEDCTIYRSKSRR